MSHTLDFGTGGWDRRRCCVHHQAAEGRGLAGVIKTRHHDLQLLPACRTRHLRLSETAQLCLRSNGSGVHGERWLCSMIPSVSQISSGTLVADRANNQLFGTLQQLGRASTHFSDGYSHLSASLLGKFAGQCLGAAPKGSATHSCGCGVLTEMRVARDLRTVCTSWTREY